VYITDLGYLLNFVMFLFKYKIQNYYSCLNSVTYFRLVLPAYPLCTLFVCMDSLPFYVVNQCFMLSLTVLANKSISLCRLNCITGSDESYTSSSTPGQACLRSRASSTRQSTSGNWQLGKCDSERV